jgi:hypothetical protein
MRNLVEVAEADAPPPVLAIYRDIRRVLGTSFVNLVYRHLATDVASLEWAWNAVRPHLVAGPLTAQTALLREAVATRCASWSLATPPAPSALIPELPAIARLVASYNHANAVNLMALSHLLPDPPSAGGDSAGATKPGVARQSATPADEDAPLPPLPALEQLTEADRQRVARLNRYAEPDEPSIVASLYRHLAVWPGVLGFAEQVLGRLEQERLLAQGRMFTAREAARIAARNPLALPPPPAGFTARFDASLRQLRDVTISKMLPIGQVLSGAFAPVPSR